MLNAAGGGSRKFTWIWADSFRKRENWTVWGNQAPEETGSFTGPTHGPAYSHTPIESLKKPSQLILCETPAVERKIRTRKTA